MNQGHSVQGCAKEKGIGESAKRGEVGVDFFFFSLVLKGDRMSSVNVASGTGRSRAARVWCGSRPSTTELGKMHYLYSLD